jgi:hypothetical protein
VHQALGFFFPPQFANFFSNFFFHFYTSKQERNLSKFFCRHNAKICQKQNDNTNDPLGAQKFAKNKMTTPTIHWELKNSPKTK